MTLVELYNQAAPILLIMARKNNPACRLPIEWKDRSLELCICYICNEEFSAKGFNGISYWEDNTVIRHSIQHLKNRNLLPFL